MARLHLRRTLRWQPGEIPRRRGGAGESFWQWRHYQAGDPIRLIDWRRSARDDMALQAAPWLREREHEESAMLCLWTDTAPSMRYHSRPQLLRKQTYAQAITQTLQLLGKRSGLQTKLFSGAEFALDALPRMRSTIVIASDFINDVAQWQPLLTQLADRGWLGLLVCTLDPAERAWEFNGRLDIHEIGTSEHQLFEHAGLLLSDYQQRIETHLLHVEKMAGKLGWQYHLGITNGVLTKDILNLVKLLNHA